MSIIDSLSQLMFNVYEAFSVVLYIKDDDMLRCRSSVTFARSFDKHKSIPVEGTLPGWVLKHNTPLVIPNFDRDPMALGYYGADEGIKSFLGYPMESQGVIIVDSKKKYVFTEKEKKILHSFAEMILEEFEQEKRSLDNEDAIEDLFCEKRILTLFSELNAAKISVQGVLQEMLLLSGGDFAFIAMEKRGKLTLQDVAGAGDRDLLKKSCRSGESIAAMVVEGSREMLLPYNSGYLREKPLFFPGEPIRTRQFFGFPLVTDDVPFGVVGFAALSGNRLKEGTIGALRNLSSLLALYYSSLWLREHAERLKDFDNLTGAIAFPVFLGLMEKAVARKDRFSLISVKLLDLADYNRRKGAEFGNNILRKVFQVIKYCSGGQSYVTRRSGGHYYVMLKGAEVFESRNTAKLLHHAVGKSLAEEKLSDGQSMVEVNTVDFSGTVQDIWGVFEKNVEKRLTNIID